MKDPSKENIRILKSLAKESVTIVDNSLDCLNRSLYYLREVKKIANEKGYDISSDGELVPYPDNFHPSQEEINSSFAKMFKIPEWLKVILVILVSVFLGYILTR